MLRHRELIHWLDRHAIVHRTLCHYPALRFNQVANEQRKADLFDQLNVAFNRLYDFR